MTVDSAGCSEGHLPAPLPCMRYTNMEIAKMWKHKYTESGEAAVQGIRVKLCSLLPSYLSVLATYHGYLQLQDCNKIVASRYIAA